VMFNYFTLLDDLNEMLVMCRSSPTCCIILNRHVELIDMNKPACDLLKIENAECYIARERTLEMNILFGCIIQDFQNGKTIFKERFKCANGNSIFVDLEVGLFFNLKDVFVFQFTQIAPV
jgi:hypothetical protein